MFPTHEMCSNQHWKSAITSLMCPCFCVGVRHASRLPLSWWEVLTSKSKWKKNLKKKDRNLPSADLRHYTTRNRYWPNLQLFVWYGASERMRERSRSCERCKKGGAIEKVSGAGKRANGFLIILDHSASWGFFLCWDQHFTLFISAFIHPLPISNYTPQHWERERERDRGTDRQRHRERETHRNDRQWERLTRRPI